MNNIEKILKSYHDPELDCLPFAHCRISEQGNNLRVVLGYPFRGMEEILIRAAQNALTAAHIPASNIILDQQIIAHAVQQGLKPLPEVRNIVLVASGKGGVGKSTVAVNLAVTLQQLGAAVGLLDADIYGPSLARMLGGSQRPALHDEESMQPILRHGLQSISIADLLPDEEQAMIWRGPMLYKTLLQLVNQTAWQNLDYLIFDLPPGTGDIQLTLAQKIPVSGAVLVTTPQDISLIDARKAHTMFERVHIPSLGILENMSYYCCPQCGHTAPLFGEEGGRRLARDYQLPLLGQLPLDIRLREYSDQGLPIALSQHSEDLDLIELWNKISIKTAIELAALPKHHTFPNIVVERG